MTSRSQLRHMHIAKGDRVATVPPKFYRTGTVLRISRKSVTHGTVLVQWDENTPPRTFMDPEDLEVID